MENQKNIVFQTDPTKERPIPLNGKDGIENRKPVTVPQVFEETHKKYPNKVCFFLFFRVNRFRLRFPKKRMDLGLIGI